MFSLLAGVLTFFFWLGSVIAILKVDARRQKEAARACGTVDFMDRSITPYMLLAFISGALPLIAYFGVTRKGAVGWLLGLGVFVADIVAVSVVGAILVFGGTALDRSFEHKKNVAFFERARAACSAPLDREHASSDPCKATLGGGNDFRLAWNPGDGKPYVELHDTACNGGRAWACDWLVSGASFYGGVPSSGPTIEGWLAKKERICKPDPKIDDACTKL